MSDVWKGKAILIVDDEADLREVIASDFLDLGCRTLEAASGNRAYELLMRQPVDVIISDIRMPDGSGLDLLNRIRQAFSSPPVFCLVTAYTDISESEAMHLGVSAVFPKPFERHEMIDSIERALKKRELP